jgi:hypothetical protein
MKETLALMLPLSSFTAGDSLSPRYGIDAYTPFTIAPAALDKHDNKHNYAQRTKHAFRINSPTPTSQSTVEHRTMCTSFTLHYTCTHTVTSHRCGRAAISDPNHPYNHLSSPAHHQFPSTSPSENTTELEPCDISTNFQIHDSLHDMCMACKLDAKMAPGYSTGIDRWADMSVVVPVGLRGRDTGGVRAKEEEDGEMVMGREGMNGEKGAG